MTSTPLNSSTAQQTSTFWFDIFFHWSVLIGLGIVISLGSWYVILLNGLSTRGFALEEMKTEQASIYKEIEQLDILITVPSSIYALESSEQVQELSEVDNNKYFFVRSGEVAIR
jgi:hypothetical protein